MPAYNEAPSLAHVVLNALAALQALSPQVELIVVNDGSRDGTAAVVRALCTTHSGLVLIDLSRNFGKEAAITAGLNEARGDVVVLMDADGQHPIALLPEMLKKWQQGSDVVYAVRRTRDDQSPLQARLANLFYVLINWGSRVNIPANAGDFRLMDRKVIEALKTLPEQNRFMKGLYAWVGFQSTALDYEPLPRVQGTSSFGLRGAFSLALTGMLAFSSAPLRALSVLGLLLSSAAMSYGLWVVVEYLWLGIDIPGYATLAAGMMLLSGIQLLSIGILAEYVGRIYDEVKRRPSYLVSERAGTGLPTVVKDTADT